MGSVLGSKSSDEAKIEGQKANVFDPSAIKAVLDLSTAQVINLRNNFGKSRHRAVFLD